MNNSLQINSEDEKKSEKNGRERYCTIKTERTINTQRAKTIHKTLKDMVCGS
jgi:hypothetical protein